MILKYRRYVKKIMPSIFYPVCLKYQYKRKVGKKLHFRNPINYTEKIQWAKINRRNPLLTQLSDKIEARKWVSSINW